MTKLELLKKNEELEKEILELKGIKQTPRIPTYQYSKIRDVDLEKIVDISQKLNKNRFNNWFENSKKLEENEEKFLEQLLEVEGEYLSLYSEENLKMRFLSPLLVKVDFKTDDFKDFYDEKLTYKNEKFTLTGEVDILISTGLRKAKKPYFFIQEFKRDEDYGNPRPQLLAEMISAVELNNWSEIKGSYIVGENWRFVILEKLGKDKYRYFISESLNSTKIDELKNIYKNLQFVKNEIIKMVKEEK